MAMDLPPAPPAITAPAPACHYLSQAEATTALARLQRALPGTAFSGARASEVCGMVRLELANGKTAYTDPTGRYFLLAFALDTHRGEPADNEETLSKEMDSRDKFPKEAIPGVLPAPAPVDDTLMSPIPLTPAVSNKIFPLK